MEKEKVDIMALAGWAVLMRAKPIVIGALMSIWEPNFCGVSYIVVSNWTVCCNFLADSGSWSMLKCVDERGHSDWLIKVSVGGKRRNQANIHRELFSWALHLDYCFWPAYHNVAPSFLASCLTDKCTLLPPAGRKSRFLSGGHRIYVPAGCSISSVFLSVVL